MLTDTPTKPLTKALWYLNPYSNGILTDSLYDSYHVTLEGVLILILMEYSQTSGTEEKPYPRRVLILILMEYSQTYLSWAREIYRRCLNPYSNGILTD